MNNRYKKVVIVGGGPSGLIYAIQLAKLGCKNITVLEHREPNREGMISGKTFNEVSKYLDKPIKKRANRILDSEKELLNILKAYPVTLVREKFVGMGNQCLYTQTADEEKNAIPCDLAIDATGNARAVIKSLNSHFEEKQPFTIKVIGHNPIKNHARFSLDFDTDNYNKAIKRIVLNDLKRIKIMKEFRAQHWPEWLPPKNTEKNVRQPLNVEKKDSIHVHFYSEVPRSLKDPKKWVQLLLKLKTGREDINFDFHPEGPEQKSVFPFQVNPSRVIQPAYCGSGSWPHVMPVGEAQMNSYFHHGNGIINTIERAKFFFDACTLEGEELVVNWEQYSNGISELRQATECRKSLDELTANLNKDWNLYKGFFAPAHVKEGYDEALTDVIYQLSCEITEAKEDSAALRKLINTLLDTQKDGLVDPQELFTTIQEVQSSTKIMSDIVNRLRNAILNNPSLFNFLIPSDEVKKLGAQTVFKDLSDQLEAAFLKHHKKPDSPSPSKTF